MTNAELINKLRILRGAILNPHHRTGEYVDKRFADVVSDAADALEAAEKWIDGLQKLVDINTERCEALRKQLRESHESYEKHINELEAQMSKEGEWIGVNPMVDTEQCSICGWNIPTYEFESNYCPNCGTRMRGEHDEQADC